MESTIILYYVGTMTTASQTGQVQVTNTATGSTSSPLYSDVLTKPNKSHQIQRKETGNQQSHHEVPHTAVMKSNKQSNPSSSYTPKPPYATDTENVHGGSGSKGTNCNLYIYTHNTVYISLIHFPATSSTQQAHNQTAVKSGQWSSENSQTLLDGAFDFQISPRQDQTRNALSGSTKGSSTATTASSSGALNTSSKSYSGLSTESNCKVKK